MAKLKGWSVSARITAGAVATLLVIGGGSFWVLQAFYRRQMIASLAESTTVHGNLVEQSLRYAMHTRSLSLLAEMVRGLGAQRDVEKVMILDKSGTVRYSSNPAEQGRTIPRTDRTCRICHDTEASDRGTTVIFTAENGARVFRNVNPILNSESCFGCHDASDRVNGILLVDYSMAGIEASLGAGARTMWLSALVVALTVAGVIGVLLRRIVIDRLGGLVRAVDAIENGRLGEEVPVGGGDEIGLLAEHLQRMGRSLDHSLQQLREREAFLDGVISSADDGIVVVDEELRIVAANRAFAAVAGADHKALISAPCRCASVCAEESRGECSARCTFRTGEVTHRLHTLTGPDGTARHYEIAASPLREGEAVRKVIEVWRDVTRRREIEVQLATSERLASLGLLAAGVSHELNNPLASITTCLDGLRRRLGTASTADLPDELPAYLDLIRGEVERCRGLSQRLTALVPAPRRAAGPVDIAAVLHDTAALLAYTAEKSGIEIAVEIDDQTPPVVADEPQLRQVVLNLLLNAVQAAGVRGRVRARAATAGGGLEIVVENSGDGIAPDDLPHIFEPFFSRRSDGRGTGLGLFISRILVDQLGGTLTAASAPGSGATFRVHLPVGSTA